MIVLQNFFKFSKLVVCGIYPVLFEMKISFIYFFTIINFSLVKNLSPKKIKIIDFSKNRFVTIFPIIKFFKDFVEKKKKFTDDL